MLLLLLLLQTLLLFFKGHEAAALAQKIGQVSLQQAS